VIKITLAADMPLAHHYLHASVLFLLDCLAVGRISYYFQTKNAGRENTGRAVARRAGRKAATPVSILA